MEKRLELNSPEDVSWLCSLSESELGLLELLKSRFIRPPKLKVKGKKYQLPRKIDLKTLRVLAVVIMTVFKDKVKNLVLAESGAFLESCNLLKSDLGDIWSLEEIRACLGIDSRKMRKTTFKRKPYKQKKRKRKAAYRKRKYCKRRKEESLV